MEALVGLVVLGGFFYFSFVVSKDIVEEVVEDYEVVEKVKSVYDNKNMMFYIILVAFVILFAVGESS